MSLEEIRVDVQFSSTSRGALVAMEMCRVRTRQVLMAPVAVVFKSRAIFDGDPLATPAALFHAASPGNPPGIQSVPLNFPRDAGRKYTLVIS